VPDRGHIRKVPYRLPKLLEAMDNGQQVFVVEGEKDVHSLESLGLVATCCPGGAGKWRQDFNGFFVDCDVTIIADRDEPGEKHARVVAAALTGIANSVRIAEGASGKDVTDHLAAGKTLDELVVTWDGASEAKPDLAPDLWEFLGETDPERAWVIPDLLERGDRLIWTGFEGLGKSMFVRQLAVCAAAGIHPFTFRPIEPQFVLLIDCENSNRQSRRKFRPLGQASVDARRRVPDGALRLIHRSEGIDLTRDDDAAWLLERVTAHQPDLLIIGPFYRLHAANINEETAARRTVSVLDAARVKVDCALVVEAHAGHGGPGESGKHRTVRPLGSSLLLRWPEFGYGITPACEPDSEGRVREVFVKAWRGDRDERKWPDHLVWGTPWPWVVKRDGPSTDYRDWTEPEDRHLTVVDNEEAS
jgi:5S rRNA maturation endonuclease (ribonuclease M5)